MVYISKHHPYEILLEWIFLHRCRWVLVKHFPINIDLTRNQFSELSETNYPPFLVMTSNPENISNSNITDHHIG